MDYTIKPNGEFKSAEIYFKEKPDETIRAALKAAGFRWHGVKKCWYGKMTTTEANVIICKATGAIPDGFPKMDTFDSETAEKMQNAINAIEKRNKPEINAEALAAVVTSSPEDKYNLPDHWRKVWREIGIKGVTVSKGRGGWTSHYTFTFRMLPGDLIKFDECREEMEKDVIESLGRFYSFVKDPDTGESVHYRDFFESWDAAKKQRYISARAREIYEDIEKNGRDSSCCHYWQLKRNDFPMFSDQFFDRWELVGRSVGCHNYDNSDAMTDYFDVGFYESWHISPMKDGAKLDQEEAARIHEIMEIFRKKDREAEEEKKAEQEREREEHARKEEAFALFAKESIETWEKNAPWAPGCGPYVVVEWSEIGALHEGSEEDTEPGSMPKHYSLEAFDRITADLDKWMRNHDRGYLKTKFTIEWGDELHSYTERIDVGDGDGGILGMVRHIVKYHEETPDSNKDCCGLYGFDFEYMKEVKRRLEERIDDDVYRIDSELDSLAG